MITSKLRGAGRISLPILPKSGHKIRFIMREIFSPSTGLAANYPTMLRHLYGINDLLKKDGIMAPSDASLTNTSRLYDLIGRPLDRIPTLHVGGTNGKVVLQTINCQCWDGVATIYWHSATNYDCRAALPTSCQKVWVRVDSVQVCLSVHILQVLGNEFKLMQNWFRRKP